MITIKYKWDEDMAVNSSADIYDYELQNSKKKYIGWFFVALVQFSVVGALKHQVYGLLIISTFLILYWYGLRWPIRKYFIKKTFSKSSLANSTIELQAQKDGIYKDDELQISYDNIEDVIKLDNAVLIYHHAQTLYFPNSAFSSSDKINKFINLVKNSKSNTTDS
jgi:hypothetical protein